MPPNRRLQARAYAIAAALLLLLGAFLPLPWAFIALVPGVLLLLVAAWRELCAVLADLEKRG